MVSNPSNKVKSESIDEVILRLLGLNVGVELDYQTYHDIIKKKLAIARLAGKELPREEDELLRNEFKRVRTLKDKGLRFKVKKAKTKVSFTKTSSIPGQKKLPSSAAIIKAQKGKLASTTNAISVSSNFETDGIKNTLDSILTILSSKFKFDQKQSDKERRDKETEGRGKKESALEGFKKGIGTIVSTTKKLLSPFQAIIDRIFKFIFFTLLGRGFTSFMEWMSNKGNQNKFNSFIEFLSDHWPALAGLYILFGTGFGKLVRGLLKGVTRMIIAIGMNIPKIFGFIRKNKKLAFLALAAAPLVSREIGNLFTDKETPESGLIPKTNPELNEAQKSVDKAQDTRVPKFNFGGMIPSFKMGGFNPYGGMDFSQGVPIAGAGSDDTLIAAKTGEAILTEKDQQDIGQRYVDRRTGQPLNIPQYLAGRKPGSVNMSNLRFPGFGGGFNLGGMIPRFNIGGMVGKPKSPLSGTSKFGDLPLIKAANSAGIKGLELASFLSQMSHETGGYKWSTELGGGSSSYSGGKKYKGRGYIQLTHDYNYKKYGDKLGIDLVNNPDLATNSDIAAKIAVMYWKENVRPAVGNNWNDVFSASRAINNPSASSPKGINGYEDRVSRFNQYREKLNSGALNLEAPAKPKAKKKSLGIMKTLGTALNFMPSMLPFMRGGEIKENTGMNIPGATADRQLINVAVQPGESKYIFTKQATERGASEIANLIQAKLDPNSEAARRGYRSITPYKTFGGSGMNGMMTLPPMVASGGGSSRPRAAGLAGASEVPNFSAVAPSNNRAEYASIYGLRG
jgi:putative chitinase